MDRRQGPEDRRGPERLATLEARVAQIDASLTYLHKDVRDIRDSLHRHRGFLAGFSAAFTLLWTGILALGAYAWRQIT